MFDDIKTLLKCGIKALLLTIAAILLTLILYSMLGADDPIYAVMLIGLPIASIMAYAELVGRKHQ